MKLTTAAVALVAVVVAVWLGLAAAGEDWTQVILVGLGAALVGALVLALSSLRRA